MNESDPRSNVHYLGSSEKKIVLHNIRELFQIHCMMPMYHTQSFPAPRVHSIKLRLLFNTIETRGR